MLPVTLTIAGFDCSAGAGLQADLKTFSALDTYGLTATTCIVAETPNKVTRIDPIHPDMVREQIRLLLDSYPVAAIKTGMLFDAPQIQAVADLLKDVQVPIVVDPVMLASTGDSLLKAEALTLFQDKILPLASVITPNRLEAEFLYGEKLSETLRPEDIAQRLNETFDCTCIFKGGHLDSSQGAIDIIVTDHDITYLHADWIDISSAHGTGCTFAAAVTAGLARGMTILEAAQLAKDFVTQALRGAHIWEQSGKETLIALNQTSRP